MRAHGLPLLFVDRRVYLLVLTSSLFGPRCVHSFLMHSSCVWPAFSSAQFGQWLWRYLQSYRVIDCVSAGFAGSIPEAQENREA